MKKIALILLTVLYKLTLIHAEFSSSYDLTINDKAYTLAVEDKNGAYDLELTLNENDSSKSGSVNSISILDDKLERAVYKLYKSIGDTPVINYDTFKSKFVFTKNAILKDIQLDGLSLKQDEDEDDNKIRITFKKDIPVYYKKDANDSASSLITFYDNNKANLSKLTFLKDEIKSLKKEIEDIRVENSRDSIDFKANNDLLKSNDLSIKTINKASDSLNPIALKIESSLKAANKLPDNTKKRKEFKQHKLDSLNDIKSDIILFWQTNDRMVKKLKGEQEDLKSKNDEIAKKNYHNNIQIIEDEQLVKDKAFELNASSIKLLADGWRHRNIPSKDPLNYTKKTKLKDAQFIYKDELFNIEAANIYIENGYLYVTYMKGDYKTNGFSLPFESYFNKALSIDISNILVPQLQAHNMWIELDHKYGLNVRASDFFELAFDPKNPAERIVVPEDKFIILKDSVFLKAIKLRETLLNKYVTLNGFTDLAGIKEESSNGLIQLEAGITVPLIKQTSIRTTKLTFHYFKNYSAKFLYSKIENKDKFFQTFSYSIDSSNGKPIVKNDSAKFITTLNLFNHAILRFDPIKLDLLTFDNKKHTLTIFAGAGFMTSAIQNTDSLITVKIVNADTTKSVVITNDKFNANSITYSFGFNYKLKANSYFGINVGIEFIGAKLLLNKSNRKIRQSDGADGDEFKQTKFGKNLIMIPSFTAYYYPKKSYDKRIYFRASFFKDLGTQDFYPSYQLGYSQDIEVFAKSKKSTSTP